jgi:hypothetical protein
MVAGHHRARVAVAADVRDSHWHGQHGSGRWQSNIAESFESKLAQLITVLLAPYEQVTRAVASSCSMLLGSGGSIRRQPAPSSEKHRLRPRTHRR